MDRRSFKTNPVGDTGAWREGGYRTAGILAYSVDILAPDKSICAIFLGDRLRGLRKR